MMEQSYKAVIGLTEAMTMSHLVFSLCTMHMAWVDLVDSRYSIAPRIMKRSPEHVFAVLASFNK